jgi:hypothetical protein
VLVAPRYDEPSERDVPACSGRRIAPSRRIERAASRDSKCGASAYTQVRTDPALGVPEEDHDATVLRLRMIAEWLARDNIGDSERLASAIAIRIGYTCECSRAAAQRFNRGHPPGQHHFDHTHSNNGCQNDL